VSQKKPTSNQRRTSSTKKLETKSISRIIRTSLSRSS